MKQCLGLINLSESDHQFGLLTKERPLAMLPFAGRYRIIDFALSNMVNSGITNVGVFTGSKVRSVIDHLGSGQPWDLDRKINGLFIFSPTYDYNKGYQRLGDIGLFHQNRNFIEYSDQEYVLLCKSYYVGNIDFRALFERYLESKAEIGIVYKRIDDFERRFIGADRISIDENGHFKSIGTNLGMSDRFHLSMEMYFFKKELFLQLLSDAVEAGEHNFMKQVLLDAFNRYKVQPIEYLGSMYSINNVKNYYDANMHTLNPEQAHELFYRKGQIFTKVKDEPSTFYGPNAQVRNSFVANGCRIEGFVENSILFRGVRIGKGCIVRNSIIMQKTTVEENSHLNYVVLDKRSLVKSSVTLIGDPSSPFIGGKKAIITREGFR